MAEVMSDSRACGKIECGGYDGYSRKWMVPYLSQVQKLPSRSPLPGSEMAVKAAFEAARSTDDGRPTRSSGSALSI